MRTIYVAFIHVDACEALVDSLDDETVDVFSVCGPAPVRLVRVVSTRGAAGRAAGLSWVAGAGRPRPLPSAAGPGGACWPDPARQGRLQAGLQAGGRGGSMSLLLMSQ